MSRKGQTSAETPEKVVAVPAEPTEDADGTPFGEPVDIELTDEELAEAAAFEATTNATPETRDADNAEPAEPANEEPVVAEGEPLAATDEEPEATEDDFPDAEDLLGYDEDDERPEEATDVPSGQLKFVYAGMRNSARSPKILTLIVPDDGTKADDPFAVISSGTTYTLRLGEEQFAPVEHVEWFEGHPKLVIERA